MKSRQSPTAGGDEAKFVEVRRSTRNRKAPTRQEDIATVTPTISKTSHKRAAAGGSTNKRRANYTAKHLLTSKASLLTKIELYKLFTDDRAWTILSSDQKMELLKMLPIAPHSTTETLDTDVPSLAKLVLIGNSAFKSDVTRYQDDMINGYFDPRWQQKARAAVQERARGDYDDWKEEETELWWGQKTKV